MSISKRQGLGLIVLTCSAFMAIWWNQYLPPTSGGEVMLMTGWAHGLLPYRDFSFHAPPGLPMLVQAIERIAGPHLIAAFAFGALLRLASACALYGLLLRVARPSYASTATIAAFFVSSTDISDTTFYYNHLAAASVVIGTYLGVVCAEGTRVRHRIAGICGGFLVSYAIAVKQTMLFGAAAAGVALLLLIAPRPRSGWVPWLLSLFAGAATAAAAIWIWLAGQGLVSVFQAAMASAPQSKGGIVRSLLRPLTLLGDVPNALVASIAAWVVIGIMALAWRARQTGKPTPHVLLVVLCGLFAVLFSAIVRLNEGRTLTLFLTALGWWGSLALALLYAPRLRSRDAGARDVVALGLLAFGIGYSFTVSWPLFENAAFPGLAVVTAAMLERPLSASPRRWVPAILLLVPLAMGLAVYRKCTFPHSWGFWIEPPIYSAAGTFTHPALTGLRISKRASDFYSTVSQVIREHSGPDDELFVFPNLPVLYALAGRRPATYSLAHWVDMTPDHVGIVDATRLRAHPPKILIVREDPFEFIRFEEFVYRGGRPSSVRDVIAALEAIQPQYDRVARLTDVPSPPISIFVRRSGESGLQGDR